MENLMFDGFQSNSFIQKKCLLNAYDVPDMLEMQMNVTWSLHSWSV